MHDAHIAVASLVSFGNDGLTRSFAQNVVERHSSPRLCSTETECVGGWISSRPEPCDPLQNDRPQVHCKSELAHRMAESYVTQVLP